jgi:hypothetical protein
LLLQSWKSNNFMRSNREIFNISVARLKNTSLTYHKWFCILGAPIIFSSIVICNVIKNVSSSTSHKKTPSFRLYVCTRIYEPSKPSPNDFPTLCEQFSARFPLKGRGTRRLPLLRFDLIFGYASIPIIPTFFAWWYILAVNFLW